MQSYCQPFEALLMIYVLITMMVEMVVFDCWLVNWNINKLLISTQIIISILKMNLADL